jgi:hypothetical protein
VFNRQGHVPIVRSDPVAFHFAPTRLHRGERARCCACTLATRSAQVILVVCWGSHQPSAPPCLFHTAPGSRMAYPNAPRPGGNMHGQDITPRRAWPPDVSHHIRTMVPAPDRFRRRLPTRPHPGGPKPLPPLSIISHTPSAAPGRWESHPGDGHIASLRLSSPSTSCPSRFVSGSRCVRHILFSEQ